MGRPKLWTDDVLREMVDQSRAGRGDDECWPWVGKIREDRNRAIFNQEFAHRAVYRVLVGPIPPGLLIRHTCDNPPCVNYLNHLLVGTQQDNMDDMYSRGRDRHRQGAGVNTAQLVEAQVLEIRELYAAGGISQRALAERYGVGKATINALLCGRSWAWLSATANT